VNEEAAKFIFMWYPPAFGETDQKEAPKNAGRAARIKSLAASFVRTEG
jgi:hypothetical protein